MKSVNLESLPWKTIVQCDVNYVMFKEGSNLIAVPKLKDDEYLKECFQVLLNEGRNKQLSTGGAIGFNITYHCEKYLGQDSTWPSLTIAFE